MSLEGQHQDLKSLRLVTGKTADWAELAKDCVAFANALGYALVASRARQAIASPRLIRAVNRGGGGLLMGAGVFTATAGIVSRS